MGTTNFDKINVKMSKAAGGNPGDHTLTGIVAADEVTSVLSVSFDAPSVTDLSSEFTASAGAINNTGGTTVAGETLLVVWFDQDAT